jgi:hypothetical protein
MDDYRESVGVVGSPSSTSQIVLNIVGEAGETSLLGSMVTIERELTGRTEVALGTVTEITTENPWHENISMRGVIAVHGELMGLSGRADVQGAKVNVQAVYEKQGDGYTPGGATLTMSPRTGTQVHRVTDTSLGQMMQGIEDKFYLGDIYRMPGVRLPLNPSDFSGARGAFHAGVFGPSGVGKSVFTLYYLAGQLRHPDLAMFLVDPQGQYAIERPGELPFSLQGLAKAMGREVIIKRLSSDLALPQNRWLFAELIAKTPFLNVGLNMRGYKPAVDASIEVLTDLLDRTTKWSEMGADDLLRTILEAFEGAARAGDIYKDTKTNGPADKLQRRIREALDDIDNRWDRLAQFFRPIAAVFSPTAPDGSKKTGIQRLLHQAFERQPGSPRPLIILDMTFGGDETDDLGRALNSEPTKARILRTLFDEVAQIAGRDYQAKGERLLNVLVVFDEAWRYAPKSSQDEEIKALSEKLAEYGRITRKYGLGWMYVLQNPHELNTAVWESLKSGFRAFGYGLTGADLDLIKAQVDSADSVALYRSFTQPSNMNRQYPFMLVGAISPLSFTMTPLYTSVYTSFEQWCEANADWLPADAAGRARLVAESTPPGASSGDGGVPWPTEEPPDFI